MQNVLAMLFSLALLATCATLSSASPCACAADSWVDCLIDVEQQQAGLIADHHRACENAAPEWLRQYQQCFVRSTPSARPMDKLQRAMRQCRVEKCRPGGWDNRARRQTLPMITLPLNAPATAFSRSTSALLTSTANRNLMDCNTRLPKGLQPATANAPNPTADKFAICAAKLGCELYDASMEEISNEGVACLRRMTAATDAMAGTGVDRLMPMITIGGNICECQRNALQTAYKAGVRGMEDMSRFVC